MKFLIVIVAALVFASCATTSNNTTSSNAQPTNVNNFSPDNAAISLADYLKRVPGVQVIQGGTQTKVTIRGNNSMTGNLEPLFVINGVNVGFGYENVEPLVAVPDIASVQVLKSGQETAAYGMQGSNGVIVIRTKKR